MYVINFTTYLLTPHQSNQVNSILLLLKFQLLFITSYIAYLGLPVCSAAIYLP